MTGKTISAYGVTLAASQFVDYLPFENSGGRGHCWQGKVAISV